MLSEPAFFRAAPAPILPDDRLKDQDALGFVHALPLASQEAWMTWALRVRLADRLAESDPEGLRMLRAFAWEGSRQADAWGRYLDALRDYHRPGLVIRTLAEHDTMVVRLSGSMLELAPGIREDLVAAAAHFGALDQFFNNLRDMQEDAERGMCWIPVDVLAEFGIDRGDVISGRAPDMPGWAPLMQWWLDDRRIWTLRASADLIAGGDAEPAVRVMVGWTLARYDRIERVMCQVRYDYRAFPQRYWAEVRRALSAHHN